jgi:zinc protease
MNSRVTNASHFKSRWMAVVLMLTAFSPDASNAADVEVERDARVPIAYVNLVIQGGAVSDPADRLGLTRFMAEMLMRGSRRHTKEQIDLMLDQWGAQLGVETRSEYLIIRGAVLSRRLPELLALVEELVVEPVFPETEIRKLRDETVSSLMAEQANDHSLSAKQFTRFLFNGHPYGRPVAGTIRNVESIRRIDLIRQHEQLMHPDRILFLGAGDLEVAPFRRWADGLTSRMPGRQKLPALVRPVSAAGRRLQIVDKPDRTQTQIEIGQEGSLMSDPRYHALYLGNMAFGGGSFLSRLMQEIRVKRGWSYGASSAFRFGLQPRSWQVHLFPAEKDTADALAHTLAMIESLRERGITAEEFQLARQGSINSAAFMSDTPKKRIENRIIEKTLGLPDDFFETFKQRLEAVTLEQVNRALKEFLRPEALTVSVLGTSERIRPALEKASGLAPDQTVVTPYTAD